MSHGLNMHVRAVGLDRFLVLIFNSKSISSQYWFLLICPPTLSVPLETKTQPPICSASSGKWELVGPVCLAELYIITFLFFSCPRPWQSQRYYWRFTDPISAGNHLIFILKDGHSKFTVGLEKSLPLEQLRSCLLVKMKHVLFFQGGYSQTWLINKSEWTKKYIHTT